MDISSNYVENIISEDPQEVIEDISGNVVFYPNVTVDDDYLEYVRETTTTMENTFDYSTALADIQSLLKFHIAVTIGFLLLVGFIVGWKHD